MAPEEQQVSAVQRPLAPQAQQVLAALLSAAREEQQVSAALQLRELQVQPEFLASPE